MEISAENFDKLTTLLSSVSMALPSVRFPARESEWRLRRASSLLEADMRELRDVLRDVLMEVK